MATNVSELFLLSLEDEFEEEEEDYEEEDEEELSQSEIDFEAETLDHDPYWSSSVFEEETLNHPTHPIFSPEEEIRLSIDFFDRCLHPETLDTSDFRFLDGIEPVSPDYLGMGLGLGFDAREQEEPEDEDDPPMDGLRVVDWESDSELDPGPHYQGPSVPHPIRFQGDRGDFDDDFEWEEVDGRLDERDFLSMMVGERSRSSEFDEYEDGVEEEEEGRNVDWEVLLSVSNVVVDDGGFINPSEYEVLFEQFADQDSAIRGTPPAARLVVNNLPSIVLTQEDVAKNNVICAVCKDDISLEEKVKQLPCLHHYHGECILPWLGMRNTCPVCRYELPTDDPEYEIWKAQRRARSERRYDLEMFSDDLV